MIEEKKLYPVTILSSLSRGVRDRLMVEGVVLAGDLLKYNVQHLVRLMGLKRHHVEKLKEETRQLDVC